jgi:hypothetical protein
VPVNCGAQEKTARAGARYDGVAARDERGAGRADLVQRYLTHVSDLGLNLGLDLDAALHA